MLINQVMKATGLTKKAVIYYTEHGLIFPIIADNGYREYSEEDIVRLQKIKVLRKLDISLDDIRDILHDKESLETISQNRYVSLQRMNQEAKILKHLSETNDYGQAAQALLGIEQSQTIIDKLLDAFPGYYGRIVCMHFARFLNDPINDDRQIKAYETIVSFLDQLPMMSISDELQAYVIENIQPMKNEQIQEMLENTRESIQNIDQFLIEQEAALQAYLAYRQSDDYRNSLNYQLKQVLTHFHESSGYNDIFIPAMRELSPAYAKYSQQMEEANRKLLDRYPDIANLD